MDENLEKKPKRPRISEMNANLEDNSVQSSNYERLDYNQVPEGEQPQEGSQPDYYQQRGYQQRGYQRGYQPRGYQPRGYHPHYQQHNYNTPAAQEGENTTTTEDQGENTTEQQGGYNQGYRQQGGYNQGYRQQGGYNQGYRQQGYRRQGGYNQGYRQQGGYNQGYRQQGGYNQGYRQQGGYNQGYRQQGGYNQGYRQQGGYNQGGYNQGGYNQGGYNQGGYRQQRPKQKRPQGPKPQMRFTPRPKPVEYEVPVPDPNSEMRLNKFLANAGVCSRREADDLITKGLVTVNGTPATELGVKIKPTDVVEYDGKVVTSEKKCYILLNKPKDCITTSDDPNGRKTVLDLIKGACEERVYPVGRLDRNTTGVLLLTNDGDLASKLTHPKYVKKKIYQVWTDKPISEEDMQHIADGVELDDGPIHADAVSYVNANDRKQAGIEIHSGRNRVVRRIFESLGYHVVKLDRVYFAGLTKKNLARGRWRYLTQEEVNFLKQGSFE